MARVLFFLFAVFLFLGGQSHAQSQPVDVPLSGPTLAAPPAPTLAAPAETTPFAVQTDEQPEASEPTPAEPEETALGNNPAASVTPSPADVATTAQAALSKAIEFLTDGGPSIWAIAALAVITLALILWKVWRLALIGAWSKGKAGKAILAFERGEFDQALATVSRRRGVRSKMVATTLIALRDLPENRAREEVARVAKGQLAQVRSGLGALELISTIAPLLGLLGTVLGMIAAFQALQAAGSRADPALLAGGIWEALLTTAAGMAVAIPASAALTWFESVIDRIRRDLEDAAARLFIACAPEHQALALAAE